MKIKNLDVSFTLSDINGELVIILSDEEIMTTVNLNYRPDPENWKEKKSELSWEDPYYFIVADLIIGLKDRYVQLLSHDVNNPIPFLTAELNTKIGELGLAGIAKRDFDLKNAPNHVPPYDQFIAAFKQFSGLSDEQFSVTCIDAQLIIKAGKDVWEMDTFEGRAAVLQFYADQKLYDDIYTDTNHEIWNRIYHENRIDREELYPFLIEEWKIYFDDHDQAKKEESWKDLQQFMYKFREVDDLILVAYAIDEFRLFPILVMAMLRLGDAAESYVRYTELEFYGEDEDWTSIVLDKKTNDGIEPLFFIRPHL